MKFKLIFLLIGITAGFSQTNDVQQLEEIVLKGNFSPDINSGYEIQILSDSILKRQYQSLGNLLQKQANFYFKQNGNGMVSSISLRGTGASQTGVYWNGIGINSSLNGQTDFNAIQAGGFDQLEIRKGGATVLLGNGAIGGAVNLKDEVIFSDRKQASINLGAGSFGTYSGQLSGLMSTQQFYTKISLGAGVSENDYPYLETDLKNENGEISNFNINAVAGLRFNERHSLSAFMTWFDNDRNLSGTLSAESRSNLKNQDARLMLDWKYLANRYTSTLKLAYLDEEYTYLYDKDKPDNLSNGESQRLIGKYDFSYFVSNAVSFRAGLEYTHTEGNGSNIEKQEQSDFTAYALFHHEPLEKLMYNVSVRTGASSAYNIPLIYSIDSKYEFNSHWLLRGAFSTNYRLPTFNDLYWVPGGNPELKPESSLSAEIGFETQYELLTVKGTAFMIKSEDLIQWVPVSGDYWEPRNVKSASNYGFETSANFSKKLGEHMLDFWIQYDYTFAQDDELEKQLIYVPKHKATAGVNYNWRTWFANYNLQYVGQVYTTTSNTEHLDDYWTSDLEFIKSIWRNRLYLSFKVNNIFNELYQSVAYRPMPGRNYFINANFKF